MLRWRADSDRAYYARCKRALVVNEWIEGTSLADIENAFSSNGRVRLGHGDIRSFADGNRYLLESAVRIASILLETPYDENAVSCLFTRLNLGIPAEILPMTDLGIELVRSELLALWRSGISTPERIAAISADELDKLIGAKGRRLHLAVTSGGTD
jgi:helicase